VGWTAERLRAAGYDRHEILHMLAPVLVGEIWAVESEGAPCDRDRYVAALDALPGSWEEDRPPAPDHDDDDDDGDEMDALLGAVLQVLRTRGPLTPDELAASLDADRAEIEMAVADPMVVVVLGDDRLASVAALLADTLFTHRLSEEEAASETLPLGVDLAAANACLCGGDHLHLAGGGVATLSGDSSDVERIDDARLRGPQGWLGGAAAGDLVGFRLIDAVPGDERQVGEQIEIVARPGPAVVPDTLSRHLEASFGDGDQGPVRPIELLCQLAVDAPALTTGVMAPLGEVLEGAGFEVHAGYTAPAGTDWEAFDRIRHTASSAVRHGLSVDETHALVMVSELCRLYGMGMDDFDRDIAREVGGLLGNPDVAEAFADAAEESEATMNFVAQTRRLAGRRDAANLAWIESLVAGRTGAPRSSMTGPSTTSSTSEGPSFPTTSATW